MKVFITGGSGFLGKHIISQLDNKSIPVCSLSRAKYPAMKLGKVEILQGNLTDNISTKLQECDVFIHAAAHGVNPGTATWEECFSVNVSQSLKLWQHAVENGIQKFIIIGSCFEYGDSASNYSYIPVTAPLKPTGPYHSSKAAATMAALGLAKDKNLNLQVLRPFHLYGSGEPEYRFWPSLKKAASNGHDFEMTQGEQVRDFTPVEIAAKQVIESINRKITMGQPEIRNIGTGKERTLKEFAKHYWKKWNAKGQLLFGSVNYRPNEVMRYVPEIN